MATLKRLLVLLGTVLACILIVFIGGFLLGAGGKYVSMTAFVPAFIGYRYFSWKGQYFPAAMSFSLAIAGAFGLWLTEN